MDLYNEEQVNEISLAISNEYKENYSPSSFLKLSEKEVREMYKNYKTKPIIYGEAIYLLEQLFNLK